MLRSLYSATSGMLAQQTHIDTTSNNIANVNTTGFKKSRADFNDLFYQAMQYAGTNTSNTTLSPDGMEVGLGVRPSAITKMFSQGSPKETENNLDVAITGKGFFQVQLPDGTTAYTRSGNFKLDEQGNLVTSEGYLLIPQITLPEDTTQVNIGVDGTVSVTQGLQTTSNVIGQITLANFVNPAGLHSMGDNLFSITNASGDAIVGNPDSQGLGKLRQGFLELSNVRLVEEMTDLITAQRAYEANSKSIQTADAMLQTVNSLKR
ncbi:flagellar basal-body rod protein FlgG [Helicobacter pylori]|uniref:Flagellar basal-body rod protein FlgG n=40 Tax=Helicobacter pylori TaxID=210 RepID=B5Z9L6_HELPG|nr:flagellar basal-body rod protein FlgG [Helicobacter pylori]ACJ08722.1 flagellar basal-body rod protein [Helicobacter pylori P12]ADN80721.1 Flagellar basal-body rod protein [Helicobacter pylori 908]AGT74947.1 flagellar basal-body rod protein FlgF [Helicobacter pylori SouthAfrica20]EJB36583.1 flagellar basal-body rod protein FlgF [Helicobacter pylori NQ4161]EJB38649.1 flagellar basal-body rod protein FlgF [Helicobacter pylori NQ4044]EJB82885.1 flagellar basal-body rod protein FlgF [Helicobac